MFGNRNEKKILEVYLVYAPNDSFSMNSLISIH